MLLTAYVIIKLHYFKRSIVSCSSLVVRGEEMRIRIGEHKCAANQVALYGSL